MKTRLNKKPTDKVIFTEKLSDYSERSGKRAGRSKLATVTSALWSA